MGKLCKLCILLALVLSITSLLAACGDNPTVVPAATPTAIATTLAPTVVTLPTAAFTTAAVTPTSVPTTNVATTVAGTTAAALSDDLAFQPFTSDAGKFSISFPGQPQIFDKDLSTDSIPGLTHYFRVIIDKNLIFLVTYIDYPPSIINSATPDTIIDRVLQSTDSSIKLTDIKAIKLGNVPGKEVTITESDPDGNFVGYEQLYVDGARLYQVAVNYPAGNSFPKSVKTFFDSFKIISTGDTATTNPIASSGDPSDDTVEVKFDQVFYDSLNNQLKAAGITNPIISYYTSTDDKAVVARVLDSEIVKNGYRATTTRPTEQDAELHVVYSKAGQPDLLFNVMDTPTKPDDLKALSSNLDVAANKTAVNKMLAQIKGTKSMAVVVTGVGLSKAMGGTSVNTDPPTPTVAVSIDATLDKELQEMPVDSELQAALTKKYPNSDQLTVGLYATDVEFADIANQLDTNFKAHGFKIVIPNAGTPRLINNGYTGTYSVADQPDIFFISLKVPVDDSIRQSSFKSLGVSDSSAQKYADLFKDKLTVVFVIVGPDIAKFNLSK